ncbi:MAG TPA: RNA polymerase sigma factor, partial [Candidatus Hydrogenedentes bacterium]|nr:RNA polymerase sigma factor [Candidatus Hydrogenedentota bacterium]
MLRFESGSDEKVVRRVLEGQRDAFGILVRRYLPVVHAAAYARLGNAADADDVVQETFLRAFQRLGSLHERRKFGAWLLTIARNTAYTMLKSRQREAEATARVDVREPAAAPDMARRELRETVRRQIMQLDEAPRELLLLRYFSGKSIREIAALLEISPNAAKKRLARARDTLGKRIFHELEGAPPPEESSDKQAAHIMGVIAGAPAAWEGAAAGTGLGGVGSLVGGILAMKKIVVGLVVVLCAIAALLALNKAKWRKAAHIPDSAAVSQDRPRAVTETPLVATSPE